MYEFSQIVDRRITNSEKYKNTDGKIPLWIADLDFKCCNKILNSLREILDVGVLGYDTLPNDYFEPFILWEKEKNGINLTKDELLTISGVVPGLSMALSILTNKGDKVLIQPPVYYPFFNIIRDNDREIVENPLKKVNEKYEIDFEDFEKKIKGCKAMILCSPHNPVGRVFTKDELRKIADICKRENVYILSDEIHSDIIFGDNKFISMYSFDDIRDRLLVFMSTSKTFNIAGISQAVCIINNSKIREEFVMEKRRRGLMHEPAFSVMGFYSAYKYGKEWHEKCMKYLEENIDFVINELGDSKICTYKPEATYLMWLDFSHFDISDDEIENKLLNEANVILDRGSKFGLEKHYRLNVGCSREILGKAINQIKETFK